MPIHAQLLSFLLGVMTRTVAAVTMPEAIDLPAAVAGVVVAFAFAVAAAALAVGLVAPRLLLLA